MGGAERKNVDFVPQNLTFNTPVAFKFFREKIYYVVVAELDQPCYTTGCMKVFLFVLSFILILFGVSIWYYRSSPEGGFSLPKIKLPLTSGGAKSRETASTGSADGSVLSGKTEEYKGLEIVEGTSGDLRVGQNRVFLSVAKLENGGSVSVVGNWSLSNNSVGSLGPIKGSETNFSATNIGKTILFVSYQNLKAEKELVVSGAVLGTNTSVSATTGPNPTAQVAPTVTAVNIYDPDGRRLSVGDSRNFKAKVLFSDGAEKELEVDWSLSGDLGTLSRVHGQDTDFKALKMGSGQVKASYQGTSAMLAIQIN